jgi:hypothetical protein
MKAKIFLFVIIAIFTNFVSGSPIDTGMKTWYQPNNVSFTARLYGDEFEMHFRTDTDHEIVKEEDGWYYYAIPGFDGRLVASSNKVGIDNPPSASYKALSSGQYAAQMEAYKAQFQQDCIAANNWHQQKRANASGGVCTLKIGVILVDFHVPRHYVQANGDYPFPNGYPKHYFDSLIFAKESGWFDTVANAGTYLSPEAEKVYGSLCNYYNQQSCGKLDIIGKNGTLPEILNPEDPNHPGIPQWIYLDSTFEYWPFWIRLF